MLSKITLKGGGPVLGVLSTIIQKGGGPVLGVLSKSDSLVLVTRHPKVFISRAFISNSSYYTAKYTKACAPHF